MSVKEIIIRSLKKEDTPQVFGLIKELAEYEKAGHEVSNTAKQLEEEGFGKRAFFKGLVAAQKNEIVGMSIYYFRYSTRKGKILYLEDFYVKKHMRKKGIGAQLFEETLKLARKLNCVGMAWQALDWNKNAIDFYKKYDCTFDATHLNCFIKV